MNVQLTARASVPALANSSLLSLPLTEALKSRSFAQFAVTSDEILLLQRNNFTLILSAAQGFLGLSGYNSANYLLGLCRDLLVCTSVH